MLSGGTLLSGRVLTTSTYSKLAKSGSHRDWWRPMPPSLFDTNECLKVPKRQIYDHHQRPWQGLDRQHGLA